ncbi:SLBB domain-containing protein [Flavisolibacter ginsenosidimutans]|uniref:Capsule biosynthesis protein n=1 Tax=Flavisolibacter ginsenosidimutans TaxID=661481 RepID=A0A5B8UMN2_9BACT|nr:SLBB domain-containing protein [Flavisolibacter ginsenosidimutans]QEC57330.1 capsule biosynthesis protein [Flavisolibacter ginsenosidimutans]
MNCFRLFFIAIFCSLSLLATAQVPSDLSSVKASQISDAQLQQYLNQAKASGLSPDQLEAEFLRRGLPAAEMTELKLRIQQLNGNSAESTETPLETPSKNTKRTAPQTKPLELESPESLKKRSRIFGAELFSNTNLSFEPDLRMATPKNYVIGPEDELILNVYGVNLSQQRLNVSPEGTVSVKYAGVINVNGLTIEAATALLRTRLAKYYPGLASGATKLQLTLGNIRSIRVTLIGAINRPGTYTLPSLASLFNALYMSGGPAENGSFRNIELIRANKIIQRADLYDFLVKGDLSANLRLEEGDVIRVPFANLLITLNGELNRPGIFELHENENLKDAIGFAGGFKSKAFRGRITGSRFTDFEKQVLDVSGAALQNFKPQNGDEFFIDSVVNRYQNRVVISGAVFKPGAYALEAGMTLKTLINKAQGLKEDVFASRALLVRTRPDLSKEYIAIDLKPLMSGTESGLVLQKEDSLQVASIFDLKDTATVTINGAVRKPGSFRYEEGLSLKSLILKAEGYADNATGMGIEISRRKRDVQVNKAGSDIVELIRIDGDKELSGTATDIVLKPYDIVTVKEDPFYKKQISVKISGEVLLPAVYTLQSREERLSSLINRAGGLLYTANISGAKLIRKKKEVIDSSEIKRLFQSVVKDTTKTRVAVSGKNTTDVAIDLNYILKHPGSADDITLEEGDELMIPRINNTVSVNGEVFRPVDVMYENGRTMNDYISDAGGVTQTGAKGKAFVIYSNGRSAKISHPLGLFRSYPKIEPGAQIFVPQKPKKEGLDVAKAGILVSVLTALITAISVIKR